MNDYTNLNLDYFVSTKNTKFKPKPKCHKYDPQKYAKPQSQIFQQQNPTVHTPNQYTSRQNVQKLLNSSTRKLPTSLIYNKTHSKLLNKLNPSKISKEIDNIKVRNDLKFNDINIKSQSYTVNEHKMLQTIYIQKLKKKLEKQIIYTNKNYNKLHNLLDCLKIKTEWQSIINNLNISKKSNYYVIHEYNLNISDWTSDWPQFNERCTQSKIILVWFCKHCICWECKKLIKSKGKQHIQCQRCKQKLCSECSKQQQQAQQKYKCPSCLYVF